MRIGVKRNLIILSARSVRHALQHRLEELGYVIRPHILDEIYGDFIQLANRKGEIFDEDLHQLMGNQ